MEQFIAALGRIYLFRFDGMTQNFYYQDSDWEEGEVTCTDERDDEYTFDMEVLWGLAQQGRLSYWNLAPVQPAHIPKSKVKPAESVMEMLNQKPDKYIKSIVDSSKVV